MGGQLNTTEAKRMKSGLWPAEAFGVAAKLTHLRGIRFKCYGKYVGHFCSRDSINKILAIRLNIIWLGSWCTNPCTSGVPRPVGIGSKPSVPCLLLLLPATHPIHAVPAADSRLVSPDQERLTPPQQVPIQGGVGTGPGYNWLSRRQWYTFADPDLSRWHSRRLVGAA